MQVHDLPQSFVRNAASMPADACSFAAKTIATALGDEDQVNALKQHCRRAIEHHPIVDALGHTQEA